MATLILTSARSWPWWVLAGCLGELIGQFLWFHSPLPAALLIYAGNALEAMAGAWLVNRFCGRPVRLETLQEVLVFVVLAAGIAPVLSATVGSATLEWFGVKSQTFAATWPLWWIGDATGILIVTPLALVVLQNWRREAGLSAARWIEACVLGLIFLGVAALALERLPALRLHHHAASSLGRGALRLQGGRGHLDPSRSGHGGIHRYPTPADLSAMPESQREKQIMLHLFLAISALVGADRGRHIPAAPAGGGARCAEASARCENSSRRCPHTSGASPRTARSSISAGSSVTSSASTSRMSTALRGCQGVLSAIVHPDDLGHGQRGCRSLLGHGRAPAF